MRFLLLIVALGTAAHGYRGPYHQHKAGSPGLITPIKKVPNYTADENETPVSYLKPAALAADEPSEQEGMDSAEPTYDAKPIYRPHKPFQNIQLYGQQGKDPRTPQKTYENQYQAEEPINPYEQQEDDQPTYGQKPNSPYERLGYGQQTNNQPESRMIGNMNNPAWNQKPGYGQQPPYKQGYEPKDQTSDNPKFGRPGYMNHHKPYGNHGYGKRPHYPQGYKPRGYDELESDYRVPMPDNMNNPVRNPPTHNHHGYGNKPFGMEGNEQEDFDSGNMNKPVRNPKPQYNHRYKLPQGYNPQGYGQQTNKQPEFGMPGNIKYPHKKVHILPNSGQNYQNMYPGMISNQQGYGDPFDERNEEQENADDDAAAGQPTAEKPNSTEKPDDAPSNPVSTPVSTPKPDGIKPLGQKHVPPQSGKKFQGVLRKHQS